MTSSRSALPLALCAMVVAACTDVIVVDTDTAADAAVDASAYGDAADTMDARIDAVDALDANDADASIDAANDTSPPPDLIADAAIDTSGDVGTDVIDVPTDLPVACTGLADGIACAAGHCCAGVCVANGTVEHCGASCTPCPVPSFSMATCNGTVCGLTCVAGFHVCAGSCVDDTSIDNCGASCAPCSPPAHSMANCAAGRCGFNCNVGFDLCGTACVDATSTQNCGGGCNVCPTPANGTATCLSHACGFTCAAGYTAVGSGCDVTPPRLVAPLSTVNLTTRRPTLRWALAPGTSGARIQICRDVACAMIEQTVDSSGSSTTLTVDLPRGVLFWRAMGRIGATAGATPGRTWEFTVPSRSATVDSSYGAYSDLNRDGFADVVVAGGDNCGSSGAFADVYYGASSTIASPPRARLFQAGNGTFPIAYPGDINGDGYGDLLVMSTTVPNAWRVYYGSMTGVSAIAPDAMLQLPAGTSGSGAAIATAGDVNRDGYADIIAGVGGGLSNCPGGAGAAWIYLGGPNGFATMPDTTIAAPMSTGCFGGAVAGGMDVDGDGYSDVVIGAPRSTVAGIPGAGLAFVYRGSASGVVPTSPIVLNGSGSPSSHFGGVVAAPGDVDGDGFSDVVVADASSDQLFVFAGSSGGTSTTAITLTTLGTATGPIAAAGDVNADGYADLAVGNAYLNAAGVHLGSASGLGAATLLTRPTVAGHDNGAFGSAVLGGDIDHDGFSDVVVGANGGANCSGGVVGVFHGSAAGIATTAAPALGSNGNESVWGGFLARAVRARPRAFQL